MVLALYYAWIGDAHPFLLRKSVTVGISMNCPNCRLANPDSAKFCGNCGTALDGAPSPQSSPYGDQSQYQVPPLPYQASGPYGAPNTATSGGSTIAKRIGLGCLIAIVIFL